MANPQLAGIIANALSGGLVWPGDERHAATPIPLPTFHTANIPPEMAQHFAQQAGLPHANVAQLVGEALVKAIEDAGKTFVDTADLTRLKALDAEAEKHRKREVTLECVCGATVVRSAMTEVNSGKFRVQGNRLIAAIQQLSDECAVGHQAAG
ncbi:hypothetical protein EUA02_29880 [Mycobacterium paragordonae]|uniref:hypothetical protein n=1 Tax=Mycobacterium paragordonae TaxID=1389713 RepID=UPI00105DA8CD|nr:hypothetical protein [Mycobacterium paragordonae]TDK85471.1 hypothetical protein EUA02_29880 [Mycobacterium paragordonae]TDK98957.1 hypothetical protein EUA05_31105 [Mycobacterium paragordonae]